jgi:hypothetical protein
MPDYTSLKVLAGCTILMPGPCNSGNGYITISQGSTSAIPEPAPGSVFAVAVVSVPDTVRPERRTG